MGRSITPKYRLELTAWTPNGVENQIMQWKGKGKVTPEKIKDEIWSINLSFQKGYINQHIPKELGYNLHYSNGRVINQFTGDIVAEYKSPMFEIPLKTEELDAYLQSKGKNVAKAVVN